MDAKSILRRVGLWVATALLPGTTAWTAEPLPAVSFAEHPGRLSITIGGHPYATYVYQDPAIPRPYFANVQAPCGLQATRNHPPQPGDPDDHATFHPGLWLSFADLNGNDYWRLKARVEHATFVGRPLGGPGKGTFAVRNRYLTTDGQAPVCTEVARYTLLVRPAGYLLLWNTTFSSDTTDLTFGDQEEFGLGIRVNTQISVQHGHGQMLNAEGLKNGTEVWGKSSRWLDYSGLIGNRRVGLTLMPDPDNFRPSWYHARDYGFVAANPFGREAMKQGPKSVVTVKRGERLVLGFAVLTHCSPAERPLEVEQAYRDYLEVRRELDPGPPVEPVRDRSAAATNPLDARDR